MATSEGALATTTQGTVYTLPTTSYETFCWNLFYFCLMMIITLTLLLGGCIWCICKRVDLTGFSLARIKAIAKFTLRNIAELPPNAVISTDGYHRRRVKEWSYHEMYPVDMWKDMTKFERSYSDVNEVSTGHEQMIVYMAKWVRPKKLSLIHI